MSIISAGCLSSREPSYLSSLQGTPLDKNASLNKFFILLTFFEIIKEADNIPRVVSPGGTFIFVILSNDA